MDIGTNINEGASLFLLFQVFEKGLMAIPLSIDLWLHFLNFETKKYEEHPEKFAILRA